VKMGIMNRIECAAKKTDALLRRVCKRVHLPFAAPSHEI
jgi:hypothetical protein